MSAYRPWGGQIAGQDGVDTLTRMTGCTTGFDVMAVDEAVLGYALKLRPIVSR